MGHALWLRPIVSPVMRNIFVEIIAGQLLEECYRFDSIVASGNSMMGIAPIIAYKLNKQLIVVRKGESRASSFDVEQFDVCRNYIIIDDLVNTGETLNRIFSSVSGHKYGGWFYYPLINFFRGQDYYHACTWYKETLENYKPNLIRQLNRVPSEDIFEEYREVIKAEARR